MQIKEKAARNATGAAVMQLALRLLNFPLCCSEARSVTQTTLLKRKRR